MKNVPLILECHTGAQSCAGMQKDKRNGINYEMEKIFML